jgi:hypothetical protein
MPRGNGPALRRGPARGRLRRIPRVHVVSQYGSWTRSSTRTDTIRPPAVPVLIQYSPPLQGYLSFWNDNISYTLRGCIILELALRHRIAMVKDPNRRRFPLADRCVPRVAVEPLGDGLIRLVCSYIEVVDDTLTGEVLLDEALKMMKVSEKMSVGTWIDLMSGESRSVRLTSSTSPRRPSTDAAM